MTPHNIVCAIVLTITIAASAVAAYAAQGADLESELRSIEGGKVELRIPGASYRVAVFAYEDPDGTGWGTDLAAFMATKVLLGSQVSSLGVIHYRGSLVPSQESKLSYFNKVEKVVEAQRVSLAIWGMVRSIGSNVVIDTYLQIPRRVSDALLAWSFALPDQIGGGTLIAHLKPDRIHVQRLIVPLEAGPFLVEEVKRRTQLRKKPAPDSEILTVPLDQVYWMTGERTWGGSETWAAFELPSGERGWVPMSMCFDYCQHLNDAARFAGDMLGYLSHKRSIPYTNRSLTVDTAAIADQFKALGGIATAKHYSNIDNINADLKKWVGSDRPSIIPPGGAALENVMAIGKVVGEILRAEEYEKKTLLDHLLDRMADPFGKKMYKTVPTEAISNIAFDLAQASLYDPQNVDVLHNLAVLFRLAGDRERSRLAEELLRQATANLQDTQQS